MGSPSGDAPALLLLLPPSTGRWPRQGLPRRGLGSWVPPAPPRGWRRYVAMAETRRREASQEAAAAAAEPRLGSALQAGGASLRREPRRSRKRRRRRRGGEEAGRQGGVAQPSPAQPCAAPLHSRRLEPAREAKGSSERVHRRNPAGLALLRPLRGDENDAPSGRGDAGLSARLAPALRSGQWRARVGVRTLLAGSAFSAADPGRAARSSARCLGGVARSGEGSARPALPRGPPGLTSGLAAVHGIGAHPCQDREAETDAGAKLCAPRASASDSSELAGPEERRSAHGRRGSSGCVSRPRGSPNVGHTGRWEFRSGVPILRGSSLQLSAGSRGKPVAPGAPCCVGPGTTRSRLPVRPNTWFEGEDRERGEGGCTWGSRRGRGRG